MDQLNKSEITEKGFVKFDFEKLKTAILEAKKLKPISAQKILDKGLQEFPTLVQGILPIKGVVALAGSSDLGKSYLLQQLAVAVASGAEDFIGFKLNVEKQAALYISTEDDDNSMCMRLNYLKNLGTEAGMQNLKFIFNSKELVKRIKRELHITPVSLVVIDSFADVFPGRLNDSPSVRNFFADFTSIAQEHDCLIIFNHHCGKHNEYKIPSKNNLLGSQGFESFMRVVMELRQDLKDENKRHLCIVKGNNMGNEAKSRSYELVFDFEKGFKNTGKRLDFEDIYQKVNPNSNNNNDLIKKIIEMKNCGCPCRKITENLKEEGINVCKTKVAEIIKKYLSEGLKNDSQNNTVNENNNSCADA